MFSVFCKITLRRIKEELEPVNAVQPNKVSGWSASRLSPNSGMCVQVLVFRAAMILTEK